QSLNFPAQQIRTLGGGASQYSLTTGTPAATVNQNDVGLFLEDSFRMRPNFTLNLGLRYETQSNIHDFRDIAPRISIAWGIDARGTKAAKTVLRTGFGTFYDRIADNLTLQANRFNGIAQQQYLVPNPDFYPAKPDDA